VNAALMLMSSALGAGGDVTPAGWGETAAPAVVRTAGCGCDPYGPFFLEGGIYSRLKAKFGGKHTDGCCPPGPGCHPCATTTRYYQPNLLDKLRAKKAAACPCPPPCAPVGPPVATSPPTQPTDPAKSGDEVQPKSSDKLPETEPKGGNVGSAPVRLPPLPSTPAPRAPGGNRP
jgi:hypothetical protein